MIKFPEVNLQDEDEMRAFYASCGISKSTTEAAIKARRRNKPVEKEKKSSPKRKPTADDATRSHR
jgi:hypothetical protein